MKITRHILFIAFVFLLSCDENSSIDTNKYNVADIKVEKLEIEIIAKTLRELVRFKSIKQIPLLRKLNETEKDYHKRIEHENTEFEKELKKTGLSFYLHDTLFVPKKLIMNEIDDTMYYGLAIQLLSDTLKPKYFEITKIQKDSINFLKKRPLPGEIETGYCGYAGFSRIIFNKEFNRAFFYFYMDCGYGLCGSGHFILIEKKEGNWEIIRNYIIWIS